MDTLKKRYSGYEEDHRELIRKEGAIGAWLKMPDNPDLIRFRKYAKELMGEEKVADFGRYANSDIEELLDIILAKLLQTLLSQEDEIKRLRALDKVHQEEKGLRRDRIRANLIDIIDHLS